VDLYVHFGVLYSVSDCVACIHSHDVPRYKSTCIYIDNRPATQTALSPGNQLQQRHCKPSVLSPSEKWLACPVLRHLTRDGSQEMMTLLHRRELPSVSASVFPDTSLGATAADAGSIGILFSAFPKVRLKCQEQTANGLCARVSHTLSVIWCTNKFIN